MSARRKSKLALIWHAIEFAVVIVLMVLSVVGLGWSIDQNRKHRFIETHA